MALFWTYLNQFSTNLNFLFGNELSVKIYTPHADHFDIQDLLWVKLGLGLKNFKSFPNKTAKYCFKSQFSKNICTSQKNLDLLWHREYQNWLKTVESEAPDISSLLRRHVRTDGRTLWNFCFPFLGIFFNSDMKPVWLYPH